MTSDERRLSRRAFLRGAAVGGAGVLGAAVLPRFAPERDPERPPSLYEFYVDSFWMDSAGAWTEPVRPPLRGRERADIAIVGGGFAGMATAYHLARRLPGKRIVLLEGARCGYGASGRNGGFADPGQPGLGWVYEHAGPEAARAYYDATLLGLDQIRAPSCTSTASTATSRRTGASSWPRRRVTSRGWRPTRSASRSSASPPRWSTRPRCAARSGPTASSAASGCPATRS